MRGLITRTVWVLLALLSIAILGSVVRGTQRGHNDDNLEFQILPGKLVYADGASMELKFLVTNRNNYPIYIGRNLGECSGPSGFASLKILDNSGEEVPLSGCSGDSFGLSDNELLRWISEHDLFRFLEMVFRNDPANVPCHFPNGDWDSFIRLSILSKLIFPAEAVEEDKVTESVGMSKDFFAAAAIYKAEGLPSAGVPKKLHHGLANKALVS
jgi:hypothetical protein